MNRQDIISFFNRLAPEWDADMVRNEPSISRILETAGILCGDSVLDVACGTGVLIPDYLKRNPSSVTGIDFSGEMIRIARTKFTDPRVSFLEQDLMDYTPGIRFDHVVLFNAFPHFTDPEQTVLKLCGLAADGGTVTIAHGMGRDSVNRHHSGTASPYSVELAPAKEIASLFPDDMILTDVTDEPDVFIVSARKKEGPVS